MDNFEKFLDRLERMGRKEENHERKFYVDAVALVNENFSPDQERFLTNLHRQKLTMSQLQQRASEFELRIGDLGPRDEKQDSDLFSFGVFQTKDVNGKEIPPFKPNSTEWENSWCATITAKRM